MLTEILEKLAQISLARKKKKIDKLRIQIIKLEQSATIFENSGAVPGAKQFIKLSKLNDYITPKAASRAYKRIAESTVRKFIDEKKLNKYFDNHGFIRVKKTELEYLMGNNWSSRQGSRAKFREDFINNKDVKFIEDNPNTVFYKRTVVQKRYGITKSKLNTIMESKKITVYYSDGTNITFIRKQDVEIIKNHAKITERQR